MLLGRQDVYVPKSSQSLNELARPLGLGALAGARVLIVFVLSALGLSFVMWLVAVAKMLPISTVPQWATRGALAAFGFPFEQSDFVLSLPPSLLSLVVVWQMYRAGKSLRAEDHVSSADLLKTQMLRLAGLATSVLVVMVTALLVGGAPITGIAIFRSVILLVVVPAWGLRIGSEHVARWCDDRLSFAWGDAVDGSVALGARLVLALIVAAHVVFAVAVWVNFSAAAEVVSAYSAPVVAAVGLGIVQSTFAPTVWAATLTWVTGFPLRLGGDIHASAMSGFEGPLPAIPSFAIIPHSPHPEGIALLAVPVIAIALVVAFSESATLHNSVMAGIQTFLVLVLASVFFFGGIGPGGLQTTGVIPWTFVVSSAIWLEAGVGIGLGMKKLRDFYISTSAAQDPDPESAR